MFTNYFYLGGGDSNSGGDSYGGSNSNDGNSNGGSDSNGGGSKAAIAMAAAKRLGLILVSILV